MSSALQNLRNLLDEYDAPAAEVAAVGDILDLIEQGPQTLSADHFEPGHVTASAFVLDRTHTRLLLIHHRNLGTWLQPGGHVDAREDVLAAAIREVLEETGVESVPLRAGVFDIDVHPIPASRGRPPHNHYDVRFLLEAVDEDLTSSDEVLGARWVAFDEVAHIVTDRSVLRAVTKLPGVATSGDLGSVQSSVEDAAGSAGSGSPSAL